MFRKQFTSATESFFEELPFLNNKSLLFDISDLLFAEFSFLFSHKRMQNPNCSGFLVQVERAAILCLA